MNTLKVIILLVLPLISFAGDGNYNVDCVSGSGKTKVHIKYGGGGEEVASLSVMVKGSNYFKTIEYQTALFGDQKRTLTVIDQLTDKVFTATGENRGENAIEVFKFWALPGTVAKKSSPEYSKKYTFDAKVTGTDPRTGDFMDLEGGQSYIDVSCVYSYEV